MMPMKRSTLAVEEEEAEEADVDPEEAEVEDGTFPPEAELLQSLRV